MVSVFECGSYELCHDQLNQSIYLCLSVLPSLHPEQPELIVRKQNISAKLQTVDCEGTEKEDLTFMTVYK